MFKRITALLCALTICLGLILIAPVAAEAQTDQPVTDYRVGYARVDINPYVEDGKLDSGIMALPLYGSGDVWNRLSTKGLVDDNGDGKVDENDGLKATAIAVTDYEDNTVLMITVDMIGALQATKVRNAIIERVNAALACGEISNVKMDISRIYYTGTHTHNAPQADAYVSAGKTGLNNDGVDLSVVNENLGIWITRTVEDIADAAILALKDRAMAKITKNQLSASEDTKSPVKGNVMNTVRHYVAEDKGCVAGDNFNDRGKDPKQVTEVNDTMYMLQFDFSDHNAATGENKLPIVLANWRGHPSLNNTDSYKKSGRNCISSDFVNAFRYNLEYNSTILTTTSYQNGRTLKYRVAFFQGAGGNVNPRGQEIINGKAACSWIDTAAKTKNDSRGNIYGRVLCAMAQHCIASTKTRQTVEAGQIRTMRYYMNSQRNATGVSALAYEAAKYYQANVGTGTYVYTNEAGETYVIGSKFHASSLVSKWDSTNQVASSSNTSMEVNTILIGEDLAFVTGSGELFEYYYKENGVFTAENNAWNDLINEASYGTPFVLELCNAMNGYVPNYYAYDYNLGSEKWARGSYEAHTTSYPQGTGEKMIDTMRWMLDTLSEGNNGAYEASCEHCGTNELWLPYDGKTEMVSGGHYYLPTDNYTAQIHVKNGKTLCFDLAGHTLTGDTRAFYTVADGNGTLNLMDSSAGKTGKVRGSASTYGAAAGFGGGVIVVDKGNTLNLYGGTLEFYEKSINTVCSGGTLYVIGTVNMYGGVIRGSYADSFTGSYISNGAEKTGSRNGHGAAVYVSGKLNVYGGEITAGQLRTVSGTVTTDDAGKLIYTQTIAPREGVGACIYSSKGYVTVAKDARIEDVYFAYTPATYFKVIGDEVPYTGRIHITYPGTLSSTYAVGKCTENTVIAPNAISYSFGDLETEVSGTKLVASVAAVRYAEDGAMRYYSAVRTAVSEYTDGYIRIMRACGENLNVERDTVLDLYGNSLTGDITVVAGATLSVKDTRTDDYTVNDNHGYGRLSGILRGNVVAYRDNSQMYLQVTEDEGISFHRVDIRISTMSLRASEAGVYYRSNFAADEVVARRVVSYGICLSVNGPEGTNQLLPSTYTVSTDFKAGGNPATGTLVSGIMKSGNTNAVNSTNAETVIYGCAYLELEDGYVFGDVVGRTLRQQLEAIDGTWDKLSDNQKAQVLQMYGSYQSVMSAWDLPNISGAYSA